MELTCESTVDVSTSNINTSTDLSERRENIRPCTNIGALEGVSVVPWLVRRSSSGYLKLLPHSSLENFAKDGFRKIEPKPSCAGNASENSSISEKESNIKKKRRKKKEHVRFLGSNCTRRGVKLCVTCKGAIGYRSKQCKHCLEVSVLPGDCSEENGVQGGTGLASSVQEQIICESENNVVAQASNDGVQEQIVHGNQSIVQTEDEDMVLLLEGCEFPEDQPCSGAESTPQEKQFPDETSIKEQVEASCADSGLISNTDSRKLGQKKQLPDKTGIQEQQVETSYASSGSLLNADATELCREQLDETSIQEQVETYASSGLLSEETSNVETVDDTEQHNMNSCHETCLDVNVTDVTDLVSGNEQHCPTLENEAETTQLVNKIPTVNSQDCTEEAIIDEYNSPLHEINTGVAANNLTPTRRKRKERSYSGRKKKQKIVCPVVQFMTIIPKPPMDEKPPKKNTGRNDSRKLLSSNATRRGVMPCVLCHKDVGCRSKVCKHCKVAIQYNESKPLEHKNLLIVKLSPSTDPKAVVFSIKKLCTLSEERCILKQMKAREAESDAKCHEEKEQPPKTYNKSTWSCDCGHDDERSTKYGVCIHATFFMRTPKVVQARTAKLREKTIDLLPIENSFKDKLKDLWEQNQTQNLPLVQQVALNTLVVLETEKASDNCADAEYGNKDSECSSGCVSTNCVHVRFEKIKRQSCVQPHIYCSGKSCSYWSADIEGENKDTPVTCLHYCISLWAIASDIELEGYFKIFLEAPLVYLHSEIFQDVAST